MKFLQIFTSRPSKKGVVGINRRNLEYIYTHNKRASFPNVDNKILCKKMLNEHNIPVPYTIFVVDGPRTLIEWQNHVKEYSKFVIKPNRGFGGNGIKLITTREDSFYSSGEIIEPNEISFHLKSICNGAFSIDNTTDCAYFEEMVTNHPDLSIFTPGENDGINDIRIIYQDNNPVMAMLRVPTKESDGKANLHQGGIGIGIDLNSSLTVGGCHKNNLIDTHPDSGVKLEGHKIPYFDKMLSAGSKIADIVNLGYIGVDFACDKQKGEVVLEVNARPGLNIQLANQLGLGYRVK